MKFNEQDLQSNIMDLIQEREKYRMQALIYREALQDIAVLGLDQYMVDNLDGSEAIETARKALKAGEDV